MPVRVISISLNTLKPLMIAALDAEGDGRPDCPNRLSV